jgi:hypothetical protein
MTWRPMCFCSVRVDAARKDCVARTRKWHARSVSVLRVESATKESDERAPPFVPDLRNESRSDVAQTSGHLRA